MESAMPTLSMAKATAAIGISFWMAVLACVTGCFQPSFADSASKTIYHRHTGYSADDTDCCHRSDTNPAHHKKQSPENSCCPFEVTVVERRAGVAPIAIMDRIPVPSLVFCLTLSRTLRRSESRRTVW